MSALELDLWWGPREPSQADDARKLSHFVSGLPAFDSAYLSWLKSPKTEKPVLPVPLDKDQAKQVLAEYIGKHDDGRTWLESGSRFAGGHAGPPPYDFSKMTMASSRCHVGAFGESAGPNPNNIFMRLSEQRLSTGRPWRASELRPLMKFAREVWNPAEMCAMFSFHILDLPSIPSPLWAQGKQVLTPRIGWITYLPPDLAARAKYPADIHVETFDDGAALVTLCEEPFEKGDAEGLARLHALEAALRPIQS